MISSLDSSGDPFLYNLNRLQQKFAQTEAQLSSGKQVTTPADAPDQITPLLNLRTQQTILAQRQKNVQQLQAANSAADQAISTALTLTDQALGLGAQGATGLQSAQTRATLARQVQGVQQQLVSLANTQVNGKYIFGGDQDQNGVYAFNASSSNGVTQLGALTNTRLVDDGLGQLAKPSLTAQEIFDPRNADNSPASGNLLVSLQNLSTALAGGTADNVTTAISDLKTASQFVNSQQGFYGDWQQRLTAASNTISQQLTTVQSGIAGIEDADLAQAAIDLSQEQIGLQAAYSGRAKAPHTSLFDFLG